MIELQDVTKVYGTKLAVDHLNLRIEQGELFAFLGPNGAGKTTTIKMMCGLLFPTSGTIRVGGYDLEREGDQARQLLPGLLGGSLRHGQFFVQLVGDALLLRFLVAQHGGQRQV